MRKNLCHAGKLPAVLGLLGLLTLLAVGVRGATEVSPAALEMALKAEGELSGAIDKASEAFVFIGGGSGVLISADGYILSNYHVAGDKRHWSVRLEARGAYVNCDLVGADPVGDLALLKVRDGKNLPYLEFGDIEKVRLGQQVLALGDPFKLADLEGPPAVSIGTLSSLHRYQGNYCDAIQTDCAINPGNSGGPLVTLDGKLIGITGQIMSRFGAKANTGIGYAIPIDQIARFLPLLQAAGGRTVYHGSLPDGLTFASHLDETQMASVEKVEPDSQAARAGFKTGDRVVAVDGKPVYNFARLNGIVRSYPENTAVAVQLERAGKRVDLRLTLTRMDAPPMPAYVHSVGMELEGAKTGDGLRVARIDAGSIAARAGLLAGDVIETVDGRRPTLTWQNLLAAKQPGDRVELRVRRSGAAGVASRSLTLSLVIE